MYSIWLRFISIHFFCSALRFCYALLRFYFCAAEIFSRSIVIYFCVAEIFSIDWDFSWTKKAHFLLNWKWCCGFWNSFSFSFWPEKNWHNFQVKSIQSHCGSSHSISETMFQLVFGAVKPLHLKWIWLFSDATVFMLNFLYLAYFSVFSLAKTISWLWYSDWFSVFEHLRFFSFIFWLLASNSMSFSSNRFCQLPRPFID